jgi:hypothetical protein
MDDLSFRRFGRLTAMWPAGRRRRKIAWLCCCNCGNLKLVTADILRDKRTVSCGCFQQERKLKHGELAGHAALRAQNGTRIQTPEYTCWQNIQQRCRNKNRKCYRDYGGRGIRVCRRWQGKNGFSNFLADMGRRPSRRHTIERENNNRGYEPDNCKWATWKEQANNTRRNRRVQL